MQLTDELEDLASKEKTEAGNSVHIYVSHINFEATYSYLEADPVQLSLIRVYSINSITTQDCGNVPQFERMDTVTEEILDYDFREWRDAAYTVFPTTT